MKLRYDMLFLDADDTLFDFQRAETQAVSETLNVMRAPVEDEVLRLYSRINAQLWRDFEAGKVDKPFLQHARFDRLFEKIGFNGSGEEAGKLYLKRLAEASYLLPGAEALCRTLVSYGCRLYLTTNGISSVQHKRLSVSPILPLIEDIFVSEDTGFQKPQTEYYQYIFDRLGIRSRNRILAVGDSLSSDIAGGIAAGIDTCWYNPLGKEVDGILKPSYMIEKLEQLPDIVCGSGKKIKEI